MTHTFRRRDKVDPEWTTGRCPTRKREYLSKADAKLALRRMPGGRDMCAFPCSHAYGDTPPVAHWHVGHLPRSVINGTHSRADL
jgi:hypothetical protein